MAWADPTRFSKRFAPDFEALDTDLRSSIREIARRRRIAAPADAGHAVIEAAFVRRSKKAAPND
jgi:hypothetical protein